MTAILITPEHLENRLGSLWFSSAALSRFFCVSWSYYFYFFNFSVTWAAFEKMHNIGITASGPSPICLDTGDPGKGSMSWEELGGEW